MHAENERMKVGQRAAVFGVLANAVLCALKVTVGALASSTALIADGLNNLTDAAGSVVTLIGFRFAAKPADRRHPYGHARSEYLAALFVCALIFVIGLELLKSSVEKILHPVCPVLSPLAIGVPILAILVKGVMFFAYQKAAARTASPALKASAADARNDVLATAVVLLCLLLEPITGLHLDGVGGLLVAVFILFNGVFLARDTVSALIGEGANPELEAALNSFVREYDKVNGCHDLLVHDYGPTRRYASLHVETSHDVDAYAFHETVDRMERECLARFGVHLTIHHDPILSDDPESTRLGEVALSVLRAHDRHAEVHDFRISSVEGGRCILFDAVLDEKTLERSEAIETELAAALKRADAAEHTLRVTFHL